MSAREIVYIDAFRPEGRLDPEARRLLARVRMLERMLRAKTAQSRALRCGRMEAQR